MHCHRAWTMMRWSVQSTCVTWIKMATFGCKRSTIFYFINNDLRLVASNCRNFSSPEIFLYFSPIFRIFSNNSYLPSSPIFHIFDSPVVFLRVHRFYWPLFLIFGVILPLNAPLEYWDESMIETILITGVLRFAITVNVSWLVNSARLVWSMEGQKLIQTLDTFNLLYKLFFKMPKSHGTVMINHDGVNVE